MDMSSVIKLCLSMLVATIHWGGSPQATYSCRIYLILDFHVVEDAALLLRRWTAMYDDAQNKGQMLW